MNVIVLDNANPQERKEWKHFLPKECFRGELLFASFDYKAIMRKSGIGSGSRLVIYAHHSALSERCEDVAALLNSMASEGVLVLMIIVRDGGVEADDLFSETVRTRLRDRKHCFVYGFQSSFAGISASACPIALAHKQRCREDLFSHLDKLSDIDWSAECVGRIVSGFDANLRQGGASQILKKADGAAHIGQKQVVGLSKRDLYYCLYLLAAFGSMGIKQAISVILWNTFLVELKGPKYQEKNGCIKMLERMCVSQRTLEEPFGIPLGRVDSEVLDLIDELRKYSE